ncbi:hypothetical protein B9Z51_08720 [Limnohabitans sp. T6-5]|uniref:hypothetical protein n=1 Tax=Limnohabitans sp. T6-5 TaxID=1100724 RepID=UPI000D3AECC0|nr:hypothetical protein [Limnohabitans sp. T6-5]PUE09006.1 hypothetical protein B9Z51_08720 [Limnohabitans sp. T6-5]
MDWLKQLAPTIACALGGPLAGMAIDSLCKATGMDAKDIKQAIAGNTLSAEQLAAVKQAEAELQAQADQLGLDFAKLEVADRQGARDASVAGGTAGRVFALSCALLVIAIGAELWVLFHGYPKTVPEIVAGRILGLLDAIATMVLAYHYGSSSGSKEKTDALHSALGAK